MDQFLDVYRLIQPEKPFLLPDPRIDPGGFHEMWRVYLILQATQRFRFFDQPIVAHHLGLQRAKFEAEEEEALRILEKSVLDDASAETIEGALKRVGELAPLWILQPGHSPDGYNGPRNGRVISLSNEPPPSLPDYRAIASEWLERNPNPFESPGRQGPAYSPWILFRRAEAGRDQQTMATMAENTRGRLSTYPPAIAEHLQQRMLAPRAADSGVGKAATAVDELSNRLAAAARYPREDASALNALATHWARLAAAADGGRAVANDEAGAWVRLAASEDRRTWFTLRDNALREVLAEMNQANRDSTAPFSARLRELLERALEEGDLDRAARLLAVDAASALLGPSERAAAQQALEQLAGARAHLEAGRVAEARRAFRAVIASATSPSGAGFAAREMKRLSKSGPR